MWVATLRTGQLMTSDDTSFLLLPRGEVTDFRIRIPDVGTLFRLPYAPLVYRLRTRKDARTGAVADRIHCMMLVDGLAFVSEVTGRVERREKWGTGYYAAPDPVSPSEAGFINSRRPLPAAAPPDRPN